MTEMNRIKYLRIANMGRLWGDVFALFAVAAVLALLTPRESKVEARWPSASQPSPADALQRG